MKPILFNTEMVWAILEGRKTVTRRVAKPQPTLDGRFWVLDDARWSDTVMEVPVVHGHSLYNKAPYHPGDILYVRETWQAVYETEWAEDAPYTGKNIRELIKNFDEIPKVEAGISSESKSVAMQPRMKYYVFRASDIEYADIKNSLIWRPSIHMPKEAARIFLRVTGVEVERLQDMRLVDCLAEGVRLSATEDSDFVKRGVRARERFAGVWDSTIKYADLPAYGWAANPWVWVICFERITQEQALEGGRTDG